MNRRLLALTWMMPPLIFPRSLQIARTLRALSERGWHTTAIAVPPAVEPFAAQDLRLERFYKGSYEIEYVEPREDVEPSPLWLRVARRLRKIRNHLEPNWVRRAPRALIQRIEADRPDALVSFAQPWANHLVALRVKRRYPDLPWIVHFSDPWVDSPYFVPGSDKARSVAMEREASIIADADAVIFTTQETADLVMAKYSEALCRKVHVVPHAYDTDLLGLVQPRAKAAKFTITHTGNLYDGREPLAFLRVLATLRAELATTNLQVEFVGYATPAMKDMVTRLDLGDLVKLTPNVPFLDSLSIAQAADLLLVIDAPADYSVFLPSKIVDYLSLRNPILALTPLAGASARVLGSLGFPTVDPADEGGILQALREALARWKRGESATPLPPDIALRQYEVAEVVQGFESVLLGAISKKDRGDG